MAADLTHLPGVAGVISSARAHAARAEQLRFHLVTLSEHAGAASRVLQCFGIDSHVQLVVMPTAWVDGRIRVVAKAAVTGPLASPLNFARFYLPRLLPSLQHALYLDSDLVVHADLRELWGRGLAVLRAGAVAVAAVPRLDAHFRYARYESKCGALFSRRYAGGQINRSAPTFNAGVFLVDLRLWSAQDLTAEAEWWMAQHSASPVGLWALGSQPILHLVLHGRWAALPPSWNLDGLGRVAHMPQQTLQEARILHWTGRHKPWLPDGLHRQLFPLGPSRVKRCMAS